MQNKVSPISTHLIWNNPWYFIACGLGTGAIPFAPGTFATLMAIPFYLLFENFTFANYLILLIAFTFFAIILCDKLSKELGTHDHPSMNLDEFVGFGFTMLLAGQGWGWVLAGFLLFRFFDILKPFPISWLDQNVKGGFGMIIDDVLAGIFSTIILGLVHWF